MTPLALLLQLSLVVAITHSQQYGESDIYEETTLTDEDFKNAEDGSYLESIPDDLKSKNHTRVPLDTDDRGHYVESNVSDAHRTRRYANTHWWGNEPIPYAVSGSYAGWQRTMIAAAIKEIMDKTCVKFKPRTKEDEDYIFIAPISGCNSVLGPSVFGGKQDLSLVYGCFYHGYILHELMHALGFYHEQQRKDRDEYIEIYWDSIKAEYKDAYKKEEYGLTYDLPYDFGSVMHYDSWGGCTCDWAWYKTMTRKDNGGSIYYSENLSDTDVKKIRKHYDCDKGLE